MHVLIIGTGSMAGEYVKVLQSMGISFSVFGRSCKSIDTFQRDYGVLPILGNDDAYGQIDFEDTIAIVAVGIMDLATSCLKAMEAGCKRILIEKPGGLKHKEFREIQEKATETSAIVKVGLNRRFYSSSKKMREIIKMEGGPRTVNFEFTEFSDQVAGLELNTKIKQRWLLANSIHVIDLAFHLCGRPTEMSSKVNGKLAWHDSARHFSGSGVTTDKALFNYSANWSAPGRWKIEITTEKSRSLFQPLEELKVFSKKTMTYEKLSIDDEIDRKFKPGLYRQTEAFLEGRNEIICDLSELMENWFDYCKIGNYEV